MLEKGGVTQVQSLWDGYQCSKKQAAFKSVCSDGGDGARSGWEGWINLFCVESLMWRQPLLTEGFLGLSSWISSSCALRASRPGAVAKTKGVVDGLLYICSKCHVFVAEMWKASKPLQACVQEKFLGEESLQWCNKLQFAPNVKYYKCGWCNSISKSLRGLQ